MIILTAKLIKIALLILMICGGIYLFKNKLSKKHLTLFIVLIMFFAYVAQVVSSYIPPLTDEITLTALGTKNEIATTSEIFFKGFTVDGEEILPSQPTDGKWFWQGNDTLCWRPETDRRQPDGVTNHVTLRVPVGWNRTVNFYGNTWCGFVEIETNLDRWIIDTCADKSTSISKSIGRSETSSLILNQIRYLVVYLLILAVLWAVTVKIIYQLIEYPENSRTWGINHHGKLIYGSIAFITFCLMFYYAGISSFWCDEVMAIAYYNGTIGKAIQKCLNIIEYHPPAFAIPATLWYSIAPYGERWLLLVSIIPCVISVYVTGLIGEEIKDKYVGILAALTCATSTVVWNSQAYEFRPYAMLMMFFALTIYCYIMRSKNSNSKKWRVLYSLSLLCLGMTDYYGMVACAEFFVADVYLVAKRKIHWKTGVDYIFPGFVCFAWVVGIIRYILQSGRESLGAWYMPNIANVRAEFLLLSGNIEALYWILLLGISIGIVGIWFQKKSKFDWQRFYLALFAWMVVFTIMIPIVIAQLLHTESTLWIPRYFIFLIPCACLLIGNAIVTLTEIGKEPPAFFKTAICFGLSGILFFNCIITFSQTKSSEPYREASDWIYRQISDIFLDDTIIISQGNKDMAEGWQEYYISRQGQRDPLNVQTVPTKDDLLRYKKVYVQYCHYSRIKEPLISILNEYYELETERKDIRVNVYKRK